MTHNASQFNVSFRNRLEGKPDTQGTVHEFLFHTLKIPDPTWQPTGPRSRPPQVGTRYSHATACRLAVCLNLERMHREPNGVRLWTVVCTTSSSKSCRKYAPIEIRVAKKGSPKWQPISPLDLPPSVERIALPAAEFGQWLSERNATLLREHRQWTVVISPPERRFDSMDSAAALWLQEIDTAVFQTDIRREPVVKHPAYGSVQSANGHTLPSQHHQEPTNGAAATNGTHQPNGAHQAVHGAHKWYRLGTVDQRGTVRGLGEPLPQAEALDLLETCGDPGAVLVPADGEGVTV